MIIIEAPDIFPASVWDELKAGCKKQAEDWGGGRVGGGGGLGVLSLTLRTYVRTYTGNYTTGCLISCHSLGYSNITPL